MADWLCDFLAPTLDPNQFGGLKGRFTAHALVSILHSWCSTLDQGGSVRALFVDFTDTQCVRRWLQLGFDFDSTLVRRSFDCLSN